MGVPKSSSSSGASSRICSTISFVSGVFGALSGTTWMIAVSTVSFGRPSPTYTTPSTSARRAPIASRSSKMSVVCVMSTVTMSGPL